MKNTFIKLIALCLCLFMLGALATGCSDPADNSGDSDGNTEGTYVIGLSGPLTGPVSVYGVAVKNSAQMAVDEINANGGLNGVKFTLVATDDQHDAAKVADNYATMMEKGMHLSLGCVTTAPGLEFKEMSKEDNVFFITPSASGDAIPEYDNGYQMCFADGNQGMVAAKQVNSMNLSKIGIFYKSDDPYSTGIYEQFKDYLNDSIETVEATFLGKDTDFSAQISTLKDCSFIFMPIYADAASSFMAQAKADVAPNAIYYGCDGFDGIESAEGFDITQIPQQVSMLSHFNSKATEGKAAEFIQKYTEKYGKDTLNQFGASAYDCVYAIYGAMKAAIEAGENITPDISASDLCEILKEQFNGGYTYSGNTGDNIQWETNGYVKKNAIAYTIKEANA